MIALVFSVAAGVSTYLTIHLLIRSQVTVIVPNLVGKEVVYALEVLTDLGLNTKVKQMAFHPGVPKHHIVSQYPVAGTEIKHGRDVRLIISRGPRNVIVPNLSGLNLAQANIILDQNGLKQGEISRVYHNKVAHEAIVTQHPQPGGFAIRGDGIRLLVSSGKRPETIKMIALTGMGLNQAMNRIEQNGLRVGAIIIKEMANQAGETVLAQTPEAGYPIARGSSVDLAINRPERKTVADRHRRSALFRYRAPQGFLRQHVRIMISQQSTAFNMFDGYLKPGKEIWLSIPRHSAATLFIYVDGELINTEHY